MTISHQRVRNYLRAFDFRNLFIEELGWDTYNDRVSIEIDEHSLTLEGVAHKRGLAVLVCPPMNGAIPDYGTRKRIDRQVTKAVREHLIIFVDPGQTEQVWQWMRREPGLPLRSREIRYHVDQSGDPLIQRLRSIAFSLDEEEDITILDATSRVRAAFDVERVTRRFYDYFKNEHDAFLKFLSGIPDEEMERWYVSVMLNRLMFIYFVQKKDFLDGDQFYLTRKLGEMKERGEDLYYSDFLCPLFFEGFAQRPADRSPEVRALLGNIPYLNGGLFLKHQIEELYGEQIQIPDAAFERLFAFFENYRWHLDERPLREDNEINPDVLGYIFEKYINQKQMGAYYTKEDITEYISRNTIIPFLFDDAKKQCRAAFEGEHSFWGLLQETPDRYIYEAVRHGAQHALPPEIAVGVDDVSQRDQWNTPTPPEYGLPTEIWRETVARRQRYEELWYKLVDGEVQEINDLITYNLDIQQFAQDVVETADDPDLLRAFWRALNNVTVLDPTCGSGAFLFAALNILEPLYDACLERMEAFIDELERSGDSHHPQQFSDFRETLESIAQHPNRRYFILKSIIVKNLYGVDIMAEAVEIAKLRLFLKLVAQVERVANIEPLPDIDFNIRAGNTLVGFATEGEFAGRLFAQKVLPRIETLTGTVAQFRRAQLRGETTAEQMKTLKDNANAALAEIKDVLDQNLMEDYGQSDLDEFRRSHQPFHWFVEFYNVLKNGGFDVIVGNPPYVEYRKVEETYTVRNYRTAYGKNLYIFTMERSNSLVSRYGRLGMIVPIALLNVRNTNELRRVLRENYGLMWMGNYAIRPAKLFDGVEQRLTIFVGQRDVSDRYQLFSSKYHQWYTDERQHLLSILEFSDVSGFATETYIPKSGNTTANAIIAKIDALYPDTIQKHLRKNSSFKLLFHRTPGYWIRAMDFEPYFKSPTSNRSVHHIRELLFSDEQLMKYVGAVLSSSMYFFWFFAVGNCRNLTLNDVKHFPIGKPSKEVLRLIGTQFDALMKSYNANSEIKTRGTTEFQEFDWVASKPLVDEIDRTLAQHYGFSKEELDYIINYDIKIRMGNELFEDEEDIEE